MIMAAGFPAMRAIEADFTTLAVDVIVNAANETLPGGGGGEPALPASCDRRSLEVAEAHALGSIAFPSVSTGVYGYPGPAAAPVAVRTAREFVARGTALRGIIFCCYSAADLETYARLLHS